MPEPSKVRPSQDWTHFELYERVRRTLFSLPTQFESDIFIEGMQASDLFSLNTVLAASVETHVVEALNAARSSWDPNEEYTNCRFVRQNRIFPDVVLRRFEESDKGEPLMGIELKCWYLLSKEGEPSFRYEVTPDACADADLLLVIPWALSNVLSGSPEIYTPYVVSAKQASRYVDYYWQEKRNTSQNTDINRPEGITPYPVNSDEIQDDPVADSGNNYGRVARTDMMNSYVDQMMLTELAGVQVQDWIDFLLATKEASAGESQLTLDDMELG